MDADTIGLDTIAEAFGAQVFRIAELIHTAPDDPDETAPSQATGRRAVDVLAGLWSCAHAGPAAADTLRSTFITRTGYGTLQFEWEREGRYMEIEVSQTGPLEVLEDEGGTYDEYEIASEAAAERFWRFWVR